MNTNVAGKYLAVLLIDTSPYKNGFLISENPEILVILVLIKSLSIEGKYLKIWYKIILFFTQYLFFIELFFLCKIPITLSFSISVFNNSKFSSELIISWLFFKT